VMGATLQLYPQLRWDQVSTHAPVMGATSWL
jgi:hypothetical protein